jgi:hypothetical protein
MKQKQHKIDCAGKIIAVLDFPLRKCPTRELIDLISELSRKEEIYENRFVFDPSADERKYVMSLLSPYKSSCAVRNKINALILKQHLTS